MIQMIPCFYCKKSWVVRLYDSRRPYILDIPVGWPILRSVTCYRSGMRATHMKKSSVLNVPYAVCFTFPTHIETFYLFRNYSTVLYYGTIRKRASATRLSCYLQYRTTLVLALGLIVQSLITRDMVGGRDTMYMWLGESHGKFELKRLHTMLYLSQ